MLRQSSVTMLDAIFTAPSEHILFATICLVIVALGVHEVHSKGLVQAVRQQEKDAKAAERKAA